MIFFLSEFEHSIKDISSIEDQPGRSDSWLAYFNVADSIKAKDLDQRFTGKEIGTALKDKQREALRNFFMMLPNDVASQAWVALLGGQKSKKIVMEWQSDEEFREHLKQIYLTTW